MRSSTVVVASLVAVCGYGCTGLGIQTEPSLASELVQERGLGDLWGVNQEQPDTRVSPIDDIDNVDNERSSDAWLATDDDSDWNGQGASGQPRPRVDRFLRAVMFTDEVTGTDTEVAHLRRR